MLVALSRGFTPRTFTPKQPNSSFAASFTAKKLLKLNFVSTQKNYFNSKFTSKSVPFFCYSLRSFTENKNKGPKDEENASTEQKNWTGPSYWKDHRKTTTWTVDQGRVVYTPGSTFYKFKKGTAALEWNIYSKKWLAILLLALGFYTIVDNSSSAFKFGEYNWLKILPLITFAYQAVVPGIMEHPILTDVFPSLEPETFDIRYNWSPDKIEFILPLYYPKGLAAIATVRLTHFDTHSWAITEAFVDTIDGVRYPVGVDEDKRFYHTIQLHVLEDINMLSESPFIHTVWTSEIYDQLTVDYAPYEEILPRIPREHMGFFDPVSLARETIAYNNHDLDDLLLPDEPHREGIWENGEDTSDEVDHYSHIFQDYSHR